MKALGIGLTLLLWSVVGACVCNEVADWRREQLERHRRGSWIAWLVVNGQLWRMR